METEFGSSEKLNVDKIPRNCLTFEILNKVALTELVSNLNRCVVAGIQLVGGGDKNSELSLLKRDAFLTDSSFYTLTMNPDFFINKTPKTIQNRCRCH